MESAEAEEVPAMAAVTVVPQAEAEHYTTILRMDNSDSHSGSPGYRTNAGRRCHRGNS
jgi:hypothetical protein